MLPVGGRLAHFGNIWVERISDAWRESYSGFVFNSKLHLQQIFVLTKIPASSEKRMSLESYVSELLSLHAIVPVQRSEEGRGVYSPLFLVRNSSGKRHPVLDLKYLNVFLKQESFCMESLKTISAVVQNMIG